MTAYGTQIDFMKMWTMSGQDAERKMQKFLLTGLDRISQSGSDVLTKVKVGPSISNPIVRWYEEVDYPTAISVNWTGTGTDGATAAGGTLFGAAITYENFRKVIRVGTILERESDGNQIKVSAVHASNCTFTAAVYGAASSTGYDFGLVTYQIISEVWSDFKDADATRALGRDARKVGTQIHAETFEIPWTRQNTKFELVADETQHQITALLEKLRRQVAYAVLRSKPYYSAGFVYGDAIEESTMCGISSWPVITQGENANALVYVNAATAEISKNYLDDLVRNMWLTENSNFDLGDWWIVCHPNVNQFIHDLDISFREKSF